MKDRCHPTDGDPRKRPGQAQQHPLRSSPSTDRGSRCARPGMTGMGEDGDPGGSSPPEASRGSRAQPGPPAGGSARAPSPRDRAPFPSCDASRARPSWAGQDTIEPRSVLPPRTNVEHCSDSARLPPSWPHRLRLKAWMARDGAEPSSPHKPRACPRHVFERISGARGMGGGTGPTKTPPSARRMGFSSKPNAFRQVFIESKNS